MTCVLVFIRSRLHFILNNLNLFFKSFKNVFFPFSQSPLISFSPFKVVKAGWYIDDTTCNLHILGLRMIMLYGIGGSKTAKLVKTIFLVIESGRRIVPIDHRVLPLKVETKTRHLLCPTLLFNCAYNYFTDGVSDISH